MELRDLFNRAIPINVRAYVSHLFGNRDPITEKDLTPDDLKAIKFAIQKSEKNKNKGVIGYGDYSPEWINNGFGSPGHGLADMFVQSYTNPAYRMETTLGMADYKPLSTGGYLVTDNYNFGATRKVAEQERQKGLLHLFKTNTNGLSGLLNALGNLYGSTDDEQGTPVRIEIK